MSISDGIQLFKPHDYSESYVSDGCGSGWSATVVPNTIYLLNISEACKIHDFMYYVGQNIEHKEEADRVFLNNMLRIINNKKGWYFPHFLARSRALKYYNAVHNFGGSAFWDDKL